MHTVTRRRQLPCECRGTDPADPCGHGDSAYDCPRHGGFLTFCGWCDDHATGWIVDDNADTFAHCPRHHAEVASLIDDAADFAERDARELAEWHAVNHETSRQPGGDPDMPTDHDTERDADDAAYCAAYVDAVHLGESSAIDYIRAMIHDYDDQYRALRAMPNTGGDHTRAMIAAHAMIAAYTDALRVLDIAADQANARADRARDARRWQALEDAAR